MQTFHSALPVAFHNSTWIGDRTIDFLHEESRPASSASWASFPDPHHPFDAPEPWSRLHHPDEVDLPPERTLDLERRPWWHRQSLEGKPQIVEHLRKIREQYSRIPVHTDQQLRELIANYYGMISLIDHNVGRILLALRRPRALTDNTLVVYSTDHGDWLGDHGLILKGPMAYEGLLRVGLLVQGPGRAEGQGRRRSGFDARPAGDVRRFRRRALRRRKHSRSLRTLIDGERKPRLRLQRMGPARVALRRRPRPAHGAHQAPQADARPRSGAGELYDLYDDPHEMENLFGKSNPAEKQLTDMIRSRPADAVPRLPQVGMA